MKKEQIFTWLLSAFWTTVVAQTTQLDYRPFIQDVKVWEMQVGGIKENVYYNEIDGDTMINGESWKKVYNYVFPKLLYNTYFAAIREVDKKVYAIAKGSNRPRLLYDFDLKVGDVVRCGVEGNAFGCLLDQDEQPDTLLGFPFYSYLKVERIDTIKARGLEHRRFTLTLLDAFRTNYMTGDETVIDNVVWIEGIGSAAGPFSPWMPLPPYCSILLYCWTGHTCIFGFPDFYDAEVVDYVSIIHDTHAQQMVNGQSLNSKCYDLSGRCINNGQWIMDNGQWPRGVYIKDGRKMVVK